MSKHIARIVFAIVLGLALGSVAECQVSAPWISHEIYSNADGTVQFMVIEITGYGQPLSLAGQTLVANDGSTEEHTFTFARDVPYTQEGSASGDFFLVGTQRFADLSVVKPDFVVPDGFFFVRNGSPAGANTDDAVVLHATIRLGMSEVHYQTLPTNGVDALVTESTYGDSSDYVATAVAINRTGQSSVFALPTGVNTFVEYVTYVNYPLLDYFLTGFQSEINALDTDGFPWFRTGFSFVSWINPFAEGVNPPRDLSSVCRVYLGDTHFYSISTTECAEATRYPGSYLETPEALFATLPDSATGRCLADQTPLYRLWNPGGSGHRYTTETRVRDEMLARGYLAEGYGPDNVAMCVGGTAQ